MDADRPALPEDSELLAAARAVRAHAHCPYSGFAVGAAARTTGGDIYTGVNVENASYGLTVCAERSAIAAAVAGGMQPGQLAAVAVVADTSRAVTPCGACRQVIAEFAAPNCRIICARVRGGEVRTWSLAELLPEGFSL